MMSLNELKQKHIHTLSHTLSLSLSLSLSYTHTHTHEREREREKEREREREKARKNSFHELCHNSAVSFHATIQLQYFIETEHRTLSHFYN